MGRSQRAGGGVREWGGVRELGVEPENGAEPENLGAEAENWAPCHAGTGVSCQGVFLAGGSPALPQRARPEPFVSSLARSRFGAQLRHHCSPAGSEREAGAGAQL